MKPTSAVAALVLLATAAAAQTGVPGTPGVNPGATPPAAPVDPKKPAPPAPPIAPAFTKLALGDPAPPLSIANWVRGRPIETFAPKGVYLVEFFTPASEPCRRCIPILSDLQALHRERGLTVIGVSVDSARGVGELESFVRSSPDPLAYTVALDSLGESALAYLRASGQDGLPVAFVISGGRIMWIGHPLDGLERAVDEVLAATFDLDKARADAARRAAAQAKSRPLISKLEEEFASRETDRALATMDVLAAIDPPFTGDWAVQKFAFLLLEMKDTTKAYAHASAALEGTLRSNADALKSIAWMTLAEPGVVRRDIALAKKLAQKADDLTGHNDPSILDTLARAQFDSGEIEVAQATQSRAIELCKLPSQRKELERHLRDYTAKK